MTLPIIFWGIFGVLALVCLAYAVICLWPHKSESTGIAKHSTAMVPKIDHTEMERALAEAQTHTMQLFGRHHHGNTQEFPSVTPHGMNRHYSDETTEMPAIPRVPPRVS